MLSEKRLRCWWYSFDFRLIDDKRKKVNCTFGRQLCAAILHLERENSKMQRSFVMTQTKFAILCHQVHGSIGSTQATSCYFHWHTDDSIFGVYFCISDTIRKDDNRKGMERVAKRKKSKRSILKTIFNKEASLCLFSSFSQIRYQFQT